jgi:hypothetical protein
LSCLHWGPRFVEFPVSARTVPAGMVSIQYMVDFM